jgi:signal transduction histidine kinase/ActR/RegA family two-component response regulator
MASSQWLMPQQGPYKARYRLRLPVGSVVTNKSSAVTAAIPTVSRSTWATLKSLRHVRRSVRGKLVAIVLLTTVVVLLIAGIAMLVHDLSVYRKSWAADIATEASVIGFASAPALAFDDRQNAERNLAALEGRTAVLAAALYTAKGERYAQYVKKGHASLPSKLPVGIDSIKMSGERIEVSQSIIQNGERLGTLYVHAQYDVMGRVKTYLGIFSVITLLSLVAAIGLAAAIQKVITVPLEAITKVADQIVRRRDYSLRADKTTDDEIGVVVQAFNTMLNEVEVRTQALEKSNSSLRDEVSMRLSVEAALRETDRRKDEFLATLAHELRNPLAPIRHATRILGLPTATDEQRQWSREVIARQVQHMALLVDDLLDVSRITRGRLELKTDFVSLEKLVANAIETVRPLIDARQHILKVDLPSETVELNVDPLRISQALANLLTNAAKYTDSGGKIFVSANVGPQGVAISVRDTGIGLTASAISNVFEMFSQVQSAIDRSQGGLGIGLALVRGLVALHGGTVEAVSEGLGFGCTFTIRLPRTLVVDQSAPASDIASIQSFPSSRSWKILVADDNRDAADSLALILRGIGHEVLVAYAGNEALDSARREKPDVCILDIGMPQMNGLEVARSIRAEPWGKAVLLIALTGWGQREDKEAARSAGFDDHFTKPVDVDLLAQKLAAFQTSVAPSVSRSA